MSQKFFINRRRGEERRQGTEPRLNPRLDLSHRRRRKSMERRLGKSITDDFFAFEESNTEDFHFYDDKH